MPQPPTQTHTTCLFDDFVWSACSGSGTLTASGSITNGSLGIWASGTSLSGTVVPGTGVLTFLATPSSANLAAAVTGETGTGALVFGTSPTLGTPTINGGTMGNATPWTITAGTPTVYVGLDASSHMVTGTPAGSGTVTNLTLAPGFTTTIGTQNTAGQNITTTGTINGQLWPEPQTVNYTVLTSDTGALPLANGSGSITFTLPNPATGTKGTTYQFNDESGHGYTLATVGATADFLGCSGGGGTTLAVSASTGVSVVDNGTSYSCLLYGGGSGSGTVTSVGLTVPATSIFGVTGSPVTTSGNLGLTTTGTSGGIPYFSSGTQLATSAALTNNTIVVGGGAGSAPKVGVATDTGSLFAPNEPMSYAQSYGTPTALTDGATIATNAALGNFFTVTIAGNRTLSYPTGVPSGKRQMVLYEITQDGTGNRTLTLGSGFTPSSMSLNPTAGSQTIFSCDLGSAAGTCMGGANSGTANCSSGASPAVCGAAANGSVAIPAGAAQTLVVNTTTITANSSITVDYDQSATVAGATCSTTTPTATVFAPLVITARTVGTSFTVENPGTTVTNPACINFHIN